MKIFLIFILLFIYGCLSTDIEITNIQVTEKGIDSAGFFCKGFSLSNTQVMEFFKRGREIEVKEFHDSYEYLSCYTKGTLSKGAEECNFIIRAGGTAELICNDKQGYLYVCDTCDHLLQDKE